MKVSNTVRALLLQCATSALGKRFRHARQIQGQAINAPGSDVTGWTALPTVPGAVINQVPVGGKNATLTTYQTDPNSYDESKILRAVIMVSGINRVAWNEWIFLNSSLQRASQGGGVDPSTVVLASPQFNILEDAGAYPVDPITKEPTSNVMVWSDTEWGQGGDAVFPTTALMQGQPFSGSRGLSSGTSESTGYTGVDSNSTSTQTGPGLGSFDALDSLVATYLNTTRFPKLNRVVIAGFSLGGQLVQRYSLLRNSTSQDSRMTYWISSPGSFLYLNDSRPDRIDRSCRSTYNVYKYGLEGSFPTYVQNSQARVDSSTLGQRLASRTVRYLVGLDDLIAGDGSCEARAQGPDHVRKMLNWAQYVAPYLPGAPDNGSLPSSTTLSLIKNTPHSDIEVINSDPAVQTLFLEDYPSAGQTAAAPPSNGNSAGSPNDFAAAARYVKLKEL
ncbi:hypothetical protein OC846_005616 [Tilletia horrida]|uniref:Uncharacterized protein n=1 Tax=Tilletia horrida TaxID=155126 RepID=A0AAN6GN83_9BASI|nr:hypothetical protein OC846_005616 [Tilletia horrida]KAK0561554.1 hypothetical protein OC861_005764 [Tilletia horrida]